MKIISGAQTGADQAGLDFALHHGIDIGGWVPEGWRTERGIDSVPDRFKPFLKETIGDSGYYTRTLNNVIMSDLTAIFYKTITPGSKLTHKLCEENEVDCWWINIDNPVLPDTGRRLFTKQVVNIAGSRESKCPGIYQRVLEILNEWWKNREI